MPPFPTHSSLSSRASLSSPLAGKEERREDRPIEQGHFEGMVPRDQNPS